MNTEQIMKLADNYADSEHHDYLSGEGSADFYRTALQAAIEALVQERSVLKHRSEHLASALADEQSKSDKLEIKLVDAAAECKTLRDALEGVMYWDNGKSEWEAARAALGATE